MKKHLLCTGVLLSGIAFGQQNEVASGGEASGAGGTVSYSIGQIDYISASGADGNINQGVQQPFEIFSVGLPEVHFDINASLFPNPAVNQVVLSIEAWENYKNPSFNLTDEQGRVIRKGNISLKETTVQVSDLANACYYLNVLVDNQLVKSFKLVKSNY